VLWTPPAETDVKPLTGKVRGPGPGFVRGPEPGRGRIAVDKAGRHSLAREEHLEETRRDEAERQLRRDIGFTGAALLTFNGAVGAGIFALPGTLHVQFGSFSPWLFPLFGALFLLIALPFARVAAHFSVSGGPVRYVAGFGPLASFQVGWLYWIARAAALAANLNVFATYAAAAWAPLAGGAARAVLMVLLAATLTLINVVGVRQAMRTLDLLTLLKVAPLLAAAGYGLWLAAGQLPAPGPLPPLTGLEAAALLVLYAFVGFENPALPAGETRDPRRTIPRAMIVTLLVTIALYLLVQLAYVAVMPAGAAPETPLVAFGAAVAGPAGALALTLCALFSILGNLTSIMTAAPRVAFALGADGLLPRWFARVHGRYHTPANAILFTGVVVAALALSGSFVWLAVMSTLARLIVYAASIAALPQAESATVASPARRAALVATMVPALAICLWAMFQSDWTQWRMLLVLAAAGTLLFALRPRRQPAD
jgi:amino acid transporter